MSEWFPFPWISVLVYLAATGCMGNDSVAQLSNEATVNLHCHTFSYLTYYDGSQALRCPMEELKAREERRRRRAATAAGGAAAAAAANNSSTMFPGTSSTSFGASLYATNSGCSAGALNRATRSSVAEIGAGGGGGSSGRSDEDVATVVAQVLTITVSGVPKGGGVFVFFTPDSMFRCGSSFHTEVETVLRKKVLVPFIYFVP